MNDPSYPAPPPEPTPPPTLVVRLALAVALVIGFVMVQNIAVFGLIVVSKVTGIGDIDVTSLMKGKGSTAELLVLALSDLIAAAVLVLGTVAVKQSLAAMALRWRGGMRSFLYTVPVLVIGVALPTIGNVAAHHRFAAPNVDVSLAAVLVVVGVSVGIAEELIFRGVLMTVLGVERYPWIAIGVSAVIFSALHALGPGSSQSVILNMVQVAGLVAIPFACIRVAAGSIVGLIATHSLIDATSLLQLGGYKLPKPPSAAEAFAQVAMSLAVAVGYLIWVSFHIRRRRRADQALSGIDLVS